jgi:hypothetical protein
VCRKVFFDERLKQLPDASSSAQLAEKTPTSLACNALELADTGALRAGTAEGLSAPVAASALDIPARRTTETGIPSSTTAAMALLHLVHCDSLCGS